MRITGGYQRLSEGKEGKIRQAIKSNRISIKVTPNSKQNLIEPAGENQYIVRVKEKAIEGRANEAVVKLLSKYFGIPKSNISVAIGLKSKNKVIIIH